MVVLLVGLSIMAIMMTVVMPVWHQAAQREKEAELVFRGEQYARAIALLQRKSVGALPPSIDFLVEQRFLRKKFKDPITNDDFALVLVSAAAPGSRGTPPGGASPPGGAPASGRGASAGATPTASAGSSGSPGAPAAGISGVTSKSKATSIRLYKGRNHYNEWLFTVTAAAPAGAAGQRGAGPPGAGGPGSRGGPPQGPGSPQIPPPGGPGGGGAPVNPSSPAGPASPL
jgi:type II secretory pathway pseudopilin PulG